MPKKTKSCQKDKKVQKTSASKTMKTASIFKEKLR